MKPDAHFDAIRRNADHHAFVYLLVYAAAVPVLLAFVWLLPSYYEAQTYRKLTGADVTMWDAMWVELRVQEPASRD